MSFSFGSLSVSKGQIWQCGLASAQKFKHSWITRYALGLSVPQLVWVSITSKALIFVELFSLGSRSLRLIDIYSCAARFVFDRSASLISALTAACTLFTKLKPGVTIYIADCPSTHFRWSQFLHPEARPWIHPR